MEQKRLAKGHNRMFAGVCSGIAEYFNIDPTMVRLATVALYVAGVSVRAYIVCAIVLPEPTCK